MPTPDEIRRRWKEQAQQQIPPPGAVRERNAAITARYATFFLESQPLFKWAGLAVFASHQVGLALLPYDCELLDGDIGSWKNPKLDVPLPLPLIQELAGEGPVRGLVLKLGSIWKGLR